MTEINKKFDENNKELESIFDTFHNSDIFPCSYFVGAIIRRAKAINEAFRLLMQVNNHISALSLVRMQIDNCVLLLQGTFVKDIEDFFFHIQSGKETHKYKGEKNTKIDFHERKIIKMLNKRYEGINTLYEYASSFIHFSSKHINSSYQFEENVDATNLYINMSFTVFYSNEEIENIYNSMLLVNSIILQLLKPYEIFHLKNVELAKIQYPNYP